MPQQCSHYLNVGFFMCIVVLYLLSVFQSKIELEFLRSKCTLESRHQYINNNNDVEFLVKLTIVLAVCMGSAIVRRRRLGH